MFRMNLGKQANLIFSQILGIGLLFAVSIIFLIINLYPKIFLIGEAMLGKLQTMCGCDEHLAFANHPFIFTALMLAGAGLLLFLIFVIAQIIKLKKTTNQFIKLNLSSIGQIISPKLKRVAVMLELDGRIIEINEEKPIIFCFGFLKSKICVSSGFVKKLNPSELRTTLLHEKYHLTQREPMKMFLVKIIEKILFFIPSFKQLSKQYLLFSELAADEKATNGFTNKLPLARALYKIIKSKEQLAINNNILVSSFDTVTGERINKLADKKYDLSAKFYTPKIISSILFFFFIIVLSGFFVGSSKLIPFEHKNGICLTMPQKDSLMMNEQCQMSYKAPACKMNHTKYSATYSCELK